MEGTSGLLRNSPGKANGAPKRTSAAETAESSLGTLLVLGEPEGDDETSQSLLTQLARKPLVGGEKVLRGHQTEDEKMYVTILDFYIFDIYIQKVT